MQMWSLQLVDQINFYVVQGFGKKPKRFIKAYVLACSNIFKQILLLI